MSSPIHQSDVSIRDNLGGYLARPQGNAAAPAVLVFMEAFGLNDYIRSVCDSLAQQGYAALAPDIYHGKTYAYDDLANALGTLQALTDNQIMEETRASIAFLEQQAGIDAGRLGVVGFCMGGRLAFLAATQLGERVKVAVSFYGGGIAAEHDRFGRTPPIQNAAEISAALLLLYGAEDASIPPAEHARIAQTLSENKKRYTISVFPDAVHGFACSMRGSYNPEAARRAWEMTYTHFERHL